MRLVLKDENSGFVFFRSFWGSIFILRFGSKVLVKLKKQTNPTKGEPTP